MIRIGERAAASAPATLSNLGPGFDVLGLALDVPRETVTAVVREAPGVVVQGAGPFGDRMPLEVSRNVAAFAAQRVLEAVGATHVGLELTVEKNIPPGSGLGSSAASSVGGAVAASLALGGTLGLDVLLAIARDAEGLAAGSPHLDNVAPALFGGFVAVVSTDPPVVRRLAFPDSWYLAVILPAMEIRTAEARAVLPPAIPREDAIQNTRHLAGLFDSIAREDLEAFGRHLVDRIAAPYRKHLWPYLDDAQAAARRAGAVTLEVSGTGPAVFAPCPDHRTALATTESVVKALGARGLPATAYVARVAAQGAFPSAPAGAGAVK